MINSIKERWNKPINRKERLVFSWILLFLYCICSYKVFFMPGFPFGYLHIILLSGLILIVSSFFFKRLGIQVYRSWATVRMLLFNLFFLMIEVLIYFLILTPVFLILDRFKNKTGKMNTNWSEKQYINQDYKKMG
jgi:hypothetical protein